MKEVIPINSQKESEEVIEPFDAELTKLSKVTQEILKRGLVNNDDIRIAVVTEMLECGFEEDEIYKLALSYLFGNKPQDISVIKRWLNTIIDRVKEDKPIDEKQIVIFMNNRLSYIQKPPMFYNLEIDVIYNKKQQARNAFENRIYNKEMANGKLKSINYFDIWVKSQNRQEFSGLTFLPGKSQIVENDSPELKPLLNLWKGWIINPIEGDVEPFLQLFNHLTDLLKDSDKNWFKQWIAYPLKFPGTKLKSAVIIQGLQGIGKSILAETIAKF